MNGPEQPLIYEFSGFRLDANRRQLFSADGRPVTLTSRVVAVLLYLVEHRGELVDKAALMQAVWPDTVVEENNLTQAISDLRRALGEKRGEHRFIVTDPGRGYHFVAEVRTGSDKQTAADATKSPEPSLRLAILPFENLSPDPDNAFFADGLHDEILSTLANRAPGLEVISRTTMMSYRREPKPLAEVASELHATHVLEGTVRRAGDQVRLNVQLIEGRTDRHLWSHGYSRTLTEALTLQVDVAAEVAAQLAVQLAGGAKALKPPTGDVAAYDFYLKALALRSEAKTNDADRYLDQAIARDPAFARAYAMKAWDYGASLNGDFETPEDPEGRAVLVNLLQENADKALALDPTLGLAYTDLAATHQYHWRWVEMFRAHERAMQLSPNEPNVLVIYAMLLALVGSEDTESRAWQMAQHSVDLDPRDALVNACQGIVAFFLGRYGDAAAALGKALELDPGSWGGGARVWLGLTETRRGNSAAALEALRTAEQLSTGAPRPGWLARLTWAYGVAASQEDAGRLFAALQRLAKTGSVSAISWFQAYLGIGEIEPALGWLHKAIDNRDTYGWVVPLMAKKRTFASLWDHPRFQEARRKVGFVD